MANPWEKYQTTSGPWEKYGNPNVAPVVDVANSALSGFVNGIPNTLDALGGLAATGVNAASEKLGYGQQVDVKPVYGPAANQAMGTDAYQPQTDAGRYANTAAQGASVGMLAGPVGMLSGATGGLGSEAGGDVGQAVGGDIGRVVGSIAGGVVGGAVPQTMGPLTMKALEATKRAAAPKLNEDAAKLAQRAQELGVPLSLNQVAGSRVRDNAQKISQAIPLSGVKGFEENQVSSWNKALSKTIGVDADKLTPETVNKALSNFDMGYTDALKGTTVRVTSKQLAGLDEIAKEAEMSLGKDAADTVRKNVDYVKQQMKSGFMRGEKANSIRREIMARASRGGEVKEWLGDLSSKLNEVITDSLPVDKAQSLQNLNRQYRNFKTVEPLLEKSTDGTINPAHLLQRVASSKYIKGSRAELGQDDLVDLARIGKFMTKAGGSDTMEKGGLIAGGAAAITNPVKTAGVVAGNRGYQTLYNQSQPMLQRSIDKSLRKPLKIKLDGPSGYEK